MNPKRHVKTKRKVVGLHIDQQCFLRGCNKLQSKQYFICLVFARLDIPIITISKNPVISLLARPCFWVSGNMADLVVLAGPPWSCGESRCVWLYKRPAISQQNLKWDLWRFDARGNAKACQAFVPHRCNRSAVRAAREMCVTLLWRKIHVESLCFSSGLSLWCQKRDCSQNLTLHWKSWALGFFSCWMCNSHATAPALVVSAPPSTIVSQQRSEYTNSFTARAKFILWIRSFSHIKVGIAIWFGFSQWTCAGSSWQQFSVII